ncbi:hypothetical protein ACTUVK_002574 [Stenotrophomonas rhizophila]|jgi:hypothetical protein|uniref:Uncharacterized protein n=1 Tax=Stenotrophomonas nematodicola TaxID=2656746 RepID=A0ABW7D3T5_9GAMM|nr:hypothetical protein [Stenotrophomonas sp. BIGb0135]MCS4235887.1 hypothetical protein [Stenotrophomonas sp. BIGb0135]
MHRPLHVLQRPALSLWFGLILCLAAILPAQAQCVVATTATAADAQQASAAIAAHAFAGHQAEFVTGNIKAGLAFPGPTLVDAAALEGFVQAILTGTAGVALAGGARTKYWHAASGTIVIFNNAVADCGTAFRPTGGITYYNNQN